MITKTSMVYCKKNSTESGNLQDLSRKGKLTEGWKDIVLNGNKRSARNVKPNQRLMFS